MATLEHEAAPAISIPLSAEQQEKLERAASAQGQSLNDFAASALTRAADEALMQTPDPLDKVIGIFKDEPLMDALMERVREDRRMEMEASD